MCTGGLGGDEAGEAGRSHMFSKVGLLGHFYQSHLLHLILARRPRSDQSHLLSCDFRRWGPGICILISLPLIFEKHWCIAHFLFYKNSRFWASGWGTEWEDRATAWRRHTRMGDRGRGEREVNITVRASFVQGQPCGSHHKSGKYRSFFCD